MAVANGAGCPTTALLTDMNQVLGRTAGNAVEVREAIAYLTGEGGPDAREPRQHEVTMALSAELLVTGGLFADVSAARAACERALASGAAAERFAGWSPPSAGRRTCWSARTRTCRSRRSRSPCCPAGPGIVVGDR